MESKDYTYNPSQDECQAIFLASCVECTAQKLNIDVAQAYDRMARVGLITEYVLPFYDVLHTESRENLTEDIVKTLLLWEQKKIQS